MKSYKIIFEFISNKRFTKFIQDLHPLSISSYFYKFTDRNPYVTIRNSHVYVPISGQESTVNSKQKSIIENAKTILVLTEACVNLFSWIKVLVLRYIIIISLWPIYIIYISYTIIWSNIISYIVWYTIWSSFILVVNSSINKKTKNIYLILK